MTSSTPAFVFLLACSVWYNVGTSVWNHYETQLLLWVTSHQRSWLAGACRGVVVKYALGSSVVSEYYAPTEPNYESGSQKFRLPIHASLLNNAPLFLLIPCLLSVVI